VGVALTAAPPVALPAQTSVGTSDGAAEAEGEGVADGKSSTEHASGAGPMTRSVAFMKSRYVAKK